MEEFLNILRNNSEKKTIFIGRRDILNQIEKSFNQNKNIINIYGVGGIGKTTLLKELKNIFEEDKVKVCNYDFNNFTGIEEFYENIYIWLYENGIKAYYFFMAFYIYWQKKHPNETFSDYRNSKNSANKIFNVLTQDLGIIVNSLLNIDITNINKLLGRLKDYSIKLGLNKEALKFIENLQNSEVYEIESYLPVFLGMDLSNSKTAFLFDTYEKLYENIITKNTSSYDWINNFISIVSKTCFVVIAGREKIDLEGCTHIYLESLREKESEKLVRRLGVKDEKIIKKIVESSKGHPFYINLAVDMYKRNKNSFDTEVIKKEQIFNRFVQTLTENDIQKLEILSVARIFDGDLFKYMSGKTYSDIIFQELLSYSFFSKSGEYFSMHELMRESFLLRMSKKRQKELHKDMFEYFYQKGIKNFNRLLMKEAVYHLINFADFDYVKNWYEDISNKFERKGEYEFLIDLFKEGFLLSSEKAYFLIKEALIGLEIKNHKILNNVLSTFPFIKMEAEYLGAYYYLERKKNYLFYKKLPFRKRKNFFERLRIKYKNLELKIKEPDIKTLFLIDKAKFYSKFKENHQEGINFLTKALKITQNDILKVKILDNMAKLKLKLKDYDEALNLALKSLNIKERLFEKGHIQFGISYELLALIYSETDISKMLENLLKAIKIYNKYYHKWHYKIQKLYRKLVFKVDENFIKENALEIDLYYFFHFQKLIEKKMEISEILPLIDKLRDVTEENNRIDTKILKLLISNSKNKPSYEITATKFYKKIIIEYNDKFEKRNIYYGLYQAYSKIKNLEEAEKYLQKVIDVSKNFLGNLYVISLIETIKFYKHVKKDYEKVKFYYEELLKVQTDYKKKIDTMLKYYQYAKEKELKLNLLNQALKEARKENNIYLINEVLEKFAEIYKKENMNEKILEVYNEMANNFKITGDLIRVDKVYGLITEYYLEKKDYNLVFEYYDKQIQIREKLNNINKLVKGYRFKADLYLKIGNEKSAMEYYEKALNLVDETEVESFISISYALIKLYEKFDLKEKKEILIDKRIKIAKNFGDDKNLFFAYESKLKEEFKKDNFNGVEIFKKYFNSLKIFEYKKDLIHLYIKKIRNIDKNYAYYLMFYLYENFLLNKNFIEAEKSFNNLKKYLNKNSENKYKNYFFNIANTLIKHSKYNTFIFLLKNYMEIFDNDLLDNKFLLTLKRNKLRAIFYELKNAMLTKEAIKVSEFIIKHHLNEMNEEEKEKFLSHIIKQFN